jgi:ABC-type glycerol-3-phosphate transport system permease component
VSAPAVSVVERRRVDPLGRRLGRALGRAGLHGLLFVGALSMLMPFFWMLSTSIKDPGEIFLFPVRWIPSEIHLENYRDALTALPFDVFFRNTAFVTVVATIGQLLSASLVGFGFARLRAPGRGVLFLVLIATMLLPEQVTMIPHFIIFRNLGLIDRLWALIVPSWLGVYAFYIFLCRQFFMQLPLELDDAAKIDGCGYLGIYWRILLPLSKPVLASVGVFSFLNRWNDFLHAIIYLTSRDRFTIPIGLRLFRDYDGTQWHWLMAASVVTMLPCLVVFFLSQRLFVRGIATTGLKG